MHAKMLAHCRSRSFESTSNNAYPVEEPESIFTLKKEVSEQQFTIKNMDSQLSGASSVNEFHRKEVYKAVCNLKLGRNTTPFYINLVQIAGRKAKHKEFKVLAVASNNKQKWIKVSAGFLSFLSPNKKRDAAALESIFNQLPTKPTEYNDIQEKAWSTDFNVSRRRCSWWPKWLFR